MITAPIAREQSDFVTHFFGADDVTEPVFGTFEGDAGPQLATFEEAQDHRLSDRTNRVETRANHADFGDGHAAETKGPSCDVALCKFAVSEGDERECLCGEIVVGSGSCGKTLHDATEYAAFEDDGERDAVTARELFGVLRPGNV